MADMKKLSDEGTFGENKRARHDVRGVGLEARDVVPQRKITGNSKRAE